MDAQLAPPIRVPDLSGEGSVVWRRWRVVPERSGRPLLTGLLGFPWPERLVEARCAALDPLNRGGREPGRYHRRVPASDCTCGIYASRGDLDPAALPVPRRAEPVVEGFVRLSGRIIEGASGLRAARAEVIGPLLVRVGRPPIPRAWTTVHPAGLRTLPDRYKVIWQRTTRVEPIDLLRPVCVALAERYQCSVVAGRV